MYSSIRTLLTELIDYAGLFPPASLDLGSAIANFERHRESEWGWALGRFVMPAARLGELKGSPSRLSVLIGTDAAREIAEVRAFALRRPDVVEAVEAKATNVEQVREVSAAIPSEMPTFVEIPVSDSRAILLSAISEEGCCAKVRTGGTQADAFPHAPDLVRFLQLSSMFGVCFKATAGLHHPVRGTYKLTYDEDSPSATMHGFLNLFMAAGFIRNHLATELVTQLVEEQSPAAFQFSEDGVSWRDHRLTTAEIAALRKTFAVSFGSCSFEEPIQDLRSLGLL